VVKEFIDPKASRSAIHRCLRRHRVNTLHALRPEARQAANKPFQAYEPGFVHIDVKYLPQMPDETACRYLFVAIDRATRWVFVQIKPHQTALGAAFLKALSKTCPIKIRKILTDNGKAFTDRLFGRAARSESGRHEFDQLCQALAIEHRLTRPRRPQTNGMIALDGCTPKGLPARMPEEPEMMDQRFNGRLEEVLWISASTAASKRCCAVTTSPAAKTSSAPLPVTSGGTTINCPRPHSKDKHPWPPCDSGTKATLTCLTNSHMICRACHK